MTDESTEQNANDLPVPVPDGSPDARRYDPRDYQRNLAERLFPGPSKPASKQFNEDVQRLLRARIGYGQANARDAKTRPPATERGRRNNRAALDAPAQPAPTPAATPEDIAQFRETLDQQNELLRAILESSVDTQTDARSTAQNSRTFAWAGTAIALLTLVATVIAVIAAVRST